MNRDELYRYTMDRVPEWARNPLLVGLRGSDAHGTKLPDGHENSTDDVDIFVVVRQDLDYYLSLDGYTKKREHWDSAGEDVDILVYDVRKFIYLLAGANPNTVSWLWNRDEDYLLVGYLGQRLINHRYHFLTKSLLKKLFGYAMGQRERMLKQNKYQGYMGEKRKLLVDKYGFDVKFAQHTLRLLYTGHEIMRFETAHSYRPELEREILMAVKRGEYPFETVMAWIDKAIEKFRRLEENVGLPAEVDREVVNQLLVRTMKGE